MTGKQLKEALLNSRPVIAKIKGLGEIRYDGICEIRYVKSKYLDKFRIICSAGCIDKNKNSVTFVRSKDIRYADEETEKNTADTANTDCEI